MRMGARTFVTSLNVIHCADYGQKLLWLIAWENSCEAELLSIQQLRRPEDQNLPQNRGQRKIHFTSTLSTHYRKGIYLVPHSNGPVSDGPHTWQWSHEITMELKNFYCLVTSWLLYHHSMILHSWICSAAGVNLLHCQLYKSRVHIIMYSAKYLIKKKVLIKKVCCKTVCCVMPAADSYISFLSHILTASFLLCLI